MTAKTDEKEARRKGNVYQFDAARKRKARTTFDGDRIKFELPRGKRSARSKQSNLVFRHVAIFVAAVLALTFVVRWFGQVSAP
ncbi:MAG: hypothetical protein AB1441_04390 [Bacillota bacterium]